MNFAIVKDMAFIIIKNRSWTSVGCVYTGYKSKDSRL